MPIDQLDAVIDRGVLWLQRVLCVYGAATLAELDPDILALELTRRVCWCDRLGVKLCGWG